MLDQDTFVQKVDEYAQVLYRTARSMLCRQEDCEDALQEAVAKAWASRGSLRNEAYFRTWMMRIVINECHNIQRHRKRVLPSGDIEGALEAARQEPREKEGRILALVDALPEKQRVAAVLHYVEGLPVEEVAKALRVPQSTVRGRLFQARKALKLELTSQKEVPV
ncbi:MAG: RNA polymerase sigma factor [Candidatus Limiplasma sp.]|nr:RNA polymerase sigma factor [Candidatus Limiplasma sp.]